MPLMERLSADAEELSQYLRTFGDRVSVRPLDRVPGGSPYRWAVRPRAVTLRGLRPGADPARCRWEDLVLDREPAFTIHLPDGYPRERPRVRSTRPMFHPNVDADTGEICFVSPSAWSPGVPLTWVVDQVRAIAAWQKFNEYGTLDFLDERAARWAQDHPEWVDRLRALNETPPPAEGTVRVARR